MVFVREARGAGFNSKDDGTEETARDHHYISHLFT